MRGHGTKDGQAAAEKRARRTRQIAAGVPAGILSRRLSGDTSAGAQYERTEQKKSNHIHDAVGMSIFS